MKFIPPFLLLSFLFTLSLWSASPVPYSGKIDIRGVNYFGEAQFAFSLHDGNGTTHWRNGNQPGETIKVTIRNGRYSVLLGGQGMNSLPPQLFLNHDKLYLKVEFDNEDGEGLRHLAPDQLITATPRALVADIAKVAEVAKVAQVAEKVGNGVITRDMLSSEVLTKLDANGSSASVGPITRDMLPTSVLNDLNKSVTITRDMLPADVLADLNKSSSSSSPITLSMLAPEVTAKLDQNTTIGASSITKSMLAQEVLNDLNGSTTVINPPLVGSTLAVPSGQAAPAGYSLYQLGIPKEFVWEEKAPVSVARYASDGVEVLGGKIYFIGGHKWPTEIDNTSKSFDTVEVYDPALDNWTLLSSMKLERKGAAFSVLGNKIYAIGGSSYKSVEIFDPSTNEWIFGKDIPDALNWSTAITKEGKIYVVGGRNASDQNTDQVLCFNPITNEWSEIARLPTPRHMVKLVLFNDRIWAIGGSDGVSNSKVYSLNVSNNSWREETSLALGRHWANAWVANDRIYVGGGSHKTFEIYDPLSGLWKFGGTFTENYSGSDSVVVNNSVYVVGGSINGEVSSKVYSAKVDSSPFLDLYIKDGNASAGTPLVQAEVADGSVTASKIADGAITPSKIATNSITTSQLNEQILKYLKPEITTQPQAQTVYADSNVSFSVTAEGKYVTYQWKKDDSNLTGETNATLTITDANATQHDGNYSVVVSNDFGSEESGMVEVKVSDALLNGLVGWWKFDETNGTVAYDSSGNGNDGNLTGGPTWSTGKIGGALSFDGSDDFVDLGNSSDIALTLNKSLSMWLKPTAFGSRRNPYNRSYGGTGTLTIETDGSISYFYGTAGRDADPYGTYRPLGGLTLNSWMHYCLVRNLSSMKVYLYLDGNLDKEITAIHSTAVASSDNAFIGKGYASNYHGLIDDVRIYDRALSAEEVQALYNLGQ